MRHVEETIYGKYSESEIVKEAGVWSSKFVIYKDGKACGTRDSLSAAVEAAKKAE